MIYNSIIFPLWFFGGKKSNKKLTAMQNNLEWSNTFINLVNISLGLFKWNNLPETCNERFLEETLLFDGKCGFANDPNFGFINLRCNETNSLNIYGQNTQCNLYGCNGYNRNFPLYVEGGDNSNAQAVICRDNPSSYPYYLYIMQGAERLSSCMRAIDVATMQLKRPYFITCEESQRLSVERILADIDNNVPSVITSKGFNPNDIQVLQTGSNPQVLETLWESYYKHDNYVRNILGIQNNPSVDKAERLIVDEVNSNNEIIDMNIDLRLEERKKFCEQVNETFGLNISVELRHKKEEEEYVLETENNNDLRGMEEDE